MEKKILGLMIGFLLMGANLFAADGDLIVNGNIGAGTTSPTQKLDVSGHIRTSGYIYIYPASTDEPFSMGGFSSPYNYMTIQSGRDSAGNKKDLRLTTGYWPNWNGDQLMLKADGNVGIGTWNPGTYKLYVSGTAYSTGGWQQSSDIKFKEDIKPIDSPVNKILSIRGVSYNWKTKEFKDKGFPEGRHYGVMAEEIEKVLPEVVTEGPEGEKGVSYAEIIPVLIEAIKEQQTEIERLKAEVAKLGTRN